MFAGREQAPRFLESSLERWRLRTLLRVQILIARTAGQAVRLAHRRRADDLDRKIQVAHHPPNDGELLKILLTENRGIWRKQMEQLRHDRADAAEMSRARPAAERVRERSLLDRDGKISGIQFLGARSKQDIDASLPAKLIIIRFRPRIFFVIAAGSELQRVHENADGDFALFSGCLAGGANQFAMPAVQRAHGRNQNSAAWRIDLLRLQISSAA